jgi:hypothetical protein
LEASEAVFATAAKAAAGGYSLRQQESVFATAVDAVLAAVPLSRSPPAYRPACRLFRLNRQRAPQCLNIIFLRSSFLNLAAAVAPLTDQQSDVFLACLPDDVD